MIRSCPCRFYESAARADRDPSESREKQSDQVLATDRYDLHDSGSGDVTRQTEACGQAAHANGLTKAHRARLWSVHVEARVQPGRSRLVDRSEAEKQGCEICLKRKKEGVMYVHAYRVLRKKRKKDRWP